MVRVALRVDSGVGSADDEMIVVFVKGCWQDGQVRRRPEGYCAMARGRAFVNSNQDFWRGSTAAGRGTAVLRNGSRGWELVLDP